MTENNGRFFLYVVYITSRVLFAGIDQFTGHDIELNELQELKETLAELQNKLNKISCGYSLSIHVVYMFHAQ